AIPREAAAVAELPIESIDEARATLRERMRATEAVLRPSEAVSARWQRWLDADALWSHAPVLTHGDIHPGHMMLDADGRLLGVNDWTEARVTDPSVDFTFILGGFGDAAFERFVAHYERASGRTWPQLAAHTAERWAFNPVLVAWWSLEPDAPDVLAPAHAHLATP